MIVENVNDIIGTYLSPRDRFILTRVNTYLPINTYSYGEPGRKIRVKTNFYIYTIFVKILGVVV